MVGQQTADLVARQRPPCAGHRVWHGDGKPVGVGIVGEHDIGVDLGSLGERQVERAGLLRVGEGNGREVRVGFGLLRDEHWRGEACVLESGEQGLGADAVHGGVHDADLAARARVEQGDSGVEVGVEHLVAQNLDAVVRQRDLQNRSDCVDRRRDLLVGRRDDLRAVAEVELVAVVGRWVVAGGDHHARDGTEMADREGEHGRRQHAWQHTHRKACSRQHCRGVGREVGAAVTRITPHHDDSALVPVGAQPCGQACGRASDHGTVHAVRSRADCTAQPSRTELQPAPEPVSQPIEIVGGDERFDLRPGHPIRIVVAPLPSGRDEIVSRSRLTRHHRRDTTAARRSPMLLAAS